MKKEVIPIWPPKNSWSLLIFPILNVSQRQARLWPLHLLLSWF